MKQFWKGLILLVIAVLLTDIFWIYRTGILHYIGFIGYMMIGFFFNNEVVR